MPTAVATQAEAPVALASSTMITDITTVITTGPTAPTQAKSIAASGPIIDYVGATKLVQLKFYEAQQLLNLIIAATDAADGSLATLQNILATLV